MVAWDEVCAPKKEGGLGIKNIYVWNKACMVKHLRDLARKTDSVVQMVSHIYVK